MLPDQFARIVKTVGAAAKPISLVAPDNGLHASFADTRVAHDNYSQRFCGCCATFHRGLRPLDLVSHSVSLPLHGLSPEKRARSFNTFAASALRFLLVKPDIAHHDDPKW